jgi:two-component system chemotaxis response regulator CheB
VIGVVLTGSLDDGTAGLAAIKEAGGVTIVQDPAEAFAPSMPRSAMEFVPVDHVLPLREIPLLIATLSHELAESLGGEEGPLLQPMEPDLGAPPLALREGDRPGRVSVFSCPECHGTLWESDSAGILRFRCRIGHAYSPESMLAAQTDSVDRALWAALRSLEERAALIRRLAERARERKHAWVARTFDLKAQAAEEHAAVVRRVVTTRQALPVVPDHAVESDGPELAAEAHVSDRSVD